MSSPAIEKHKVALARYGGWLPYHPHVYDAFFAGVLKAIPADSKNQGHTGPVLEFETAINGDPEMKELFRQVFIQAQQSKIKTFDELLYLIDAIIVSAPKFVIARDEHGKEIQEPIGVPLYLLFDLLSNTGAAYDLFRKKEFNVAMKNLLDAWGKYLKTPESNHTLNEGPQGWFSPAGLEHLEADGRGVFNLTYDCPKPSEPNRGFPSWDHFFIREFLPGARPFDLRPGVIYNACESTVFFKQSNVQEHDLFWLKSDRPYSLYDMLGRREDDAVRSLIGGSIYQAFLSPADYHRWHSPVKGTIRDCKVVEGTYYAVLPDAGDPEFPPDSYLRGALIRCQSWLPHEATRAVILIDSDDFGLVAFIGVGMVEVSTCDITVVPGQPISVGEELGMFHFGGSTHTLIFQKQVNLEYLEYVQIGQHLKINVPLAVAV